ncbi:MAG: cation:proton antiporter [Anaerohalosphaeraceae bacterium]|nr:cation:proton antiporter [Anaerohalosphaeraceae bacterium]
MDTRESGYDKKTVGQATTAKRKYEQDNQFVKQTPANKLPGLNKRYSTYSRKKGSFNLMVLAEVISGANKFTPLNPALLFGLIVLGGTFGARVAQKFHIPQVVGSIIVGVLLGDVLGLITHQTIEKLEPFTMFALGVIGFMIGGELRGEVFKKYGKQFFIILFSQGIGAFVLVTISCSLLGYVIMDNWTTAIATGLVFGAIASATAPAATVNVLWEFKTRGPLTAAILAIVALDDALALLLYRAAATGAKALTGAGEASSVLTTTAILLGEIFGAVALGGLAGVLLFYLLKFVKAEDKILEFALACLLLVVGISMIPGIDPILPAMTLGIVIANMMPRQSRATFGLVGKFSPPVYVTFFVLAGAHMEFSHLGIWTISMITVYAISRAIGKIFGSWLGAKWSHSPITVQRYLGICLLPQAGVAIGLAILSGKSFDSEIGRTIIMVVMSATFLMEIFGPMLVKVGVKKAGEIGMNVTEEDLIKTYHVRDVMNSKPIIIKQDTAMGEILEIFSTTESVYYPVVDNDDKIVGKITISGIKEMFANQDVAGWLLACDVTEPVSDETVPEAGLEEVFENMQKFDIDEIVVVNNTEEARLVGVLDHRKAQRKISAEVLRRRETADALGIPASLGT